MVVCVAISFICAICGSVLQFLSLLLKTLFSVKDRSLIISSWCDVNPRQTNMHKKNNKTSHHKDKMNYDD